MKIRNEKGFIVEGAAAVFLVAAATLAVVNLTPLGSILGIGGRGEGQKTTQSQSYKEMLVPYTEDGRPVKVRLEDGSEGILFKKIVTNESLDERIQPKMTLLQKLKNLGGWWIFLTIAGMFFGPLGLVMNAINGRAKAAALKLADTLKNQQQTTIEEARTIVLSVDEGGEKIKASIEAEKKAAESARALAAQTADPKLLESYNAIAAQHDAIARALEGAMKAFYDELSRRQNKSTKLLVGQLRNTNPA